jgi:hypothetical protein
MGRSLRDGEGEGGMISSQSGIVWGLEGEISSHGGEGISLLAAALLLGPPLNSFTSFVSYWIQILLDQGLKRTAMPKARFATPGKSENLD